ncbi:glycosyltransferase family 4 protein [Marinobacterium sediminicola]|uniref:Glycosyltransferase involved in cell wall bisynthesis n=1 Tax=Marinobacterium sediminicola TaxID=518898 RepID=A0ABY1RZH2_9GAMM|nr:glycosyltransferase family 4 protein [Marinobacterium sediminicola]ULG69102.1 glycosyltransferase family 4 protein [Marinobacterium sediminicola]SMR73620.1 Glycosyltransferase involved in cell wall bisynthesis [Marinobacterium sediminicola]
MKIINVLVSNKKGGLEQAFVNVSNSLVVLGHKVEAWIPEDAPYQSALDETVEIVPFSAKGFYDVLAMLKARRQLLRSAPDLIITHNSRATSILVRSRWGLPFPVLGFSHSDKLKRMQGVDTLVVLTEKMRQNSLREGFDASRVAIFPNMIWHVPELSIRRSGLEPPDPVKLGFIGRVNPEKGIDLLLEALKWLKRRGLELRLHIAGTGDSESEIRELTEALGISEVVVFDGWVDDIADWLQNIDLAVFPSRYESFGIVVLEAAAYGCPVVSTKTDGPASQITHDQDGWLAEVNSAESLAETLQYAIESYTDWPNVVGKAHERARRYSMDALLPRLQQLLERAVNDGRTQ